MQVELRLGGLISLNGQDFALGQTFALLDAVDRERSVRGAADRLKVSYRSAWGRVVALEEAMGSPVVLKTKGHGSVLTELGLALRDALGVTFKNFDKALEQEEKELARRLSVLAPATARRVRLAVSHDPLLMAALGDLPEIEASVVGSREAVERLLDGRADAAGFHAGGSDPVTTPPYDMLFGHSDFAVRPLFVRDQGLMLPAGNPLSIHDVTDIAVSRARFVNRQKGAGTRLWFDRLLTDAGIAPSRIFGYEVEEFTHQAVAAVIASGAADVGMGVRAVADRFGLAFVPIGTETYFLAARTRSAESILNPIAECVSARLVTLPGYAPPNGA
jgi:molybdate transport repressor ModE-like protein